MGPRIAAGIAALFGEVLEAPAKRKRLTVPEKQAVLQMLKTGASHARLRQL